MIIIDKIKENIIYLFNFKIVDVFILSFPKSGRTWLRLMVSFYLERRYRLPVSLEVLSLTKKRKDIPNISFVHNFGFINDKRRREIANKKVIFLVRDPRDVVVSYYHQMTKREKKFQGTISDFIRSEDYGIYKIIKFNNNWISELSGYKLIRYEDLKKDTRGVFRDLLEFIGLNDTSEESVEYAIESGQIDRMRKIEQESILKGNRIGADDVKDVNSLKVRKGKVGNYRDELSSEDAIYVDNAIKELDSVFGYTA